MHRGLEFRGSVVVVQDTCPQNGYTYIVGSLFG